LITNDSIVSKHACGDVPAIQANCYHGSIRYVSFYAGGNGVYCDADKTGKVVTETLGTADMNGNALAQDMGGGGKYRWSAWFVCTGVGWIIYRIFVLHRSLVLCMQFGRWCDRSRESIRFQVAAVFIQETVRLVPHNTRNVHRFLLMYFLADGLMADLFLMIAKGTGAMLQFVSTGYNLAGMLSFLSEIFENTTWLSERIYRVVHRLVFNNEMEFVGELLCAGVMQRFGTTLNRSHFRNSLAPAQAVSYYVWSLVGYGCILSVLLGTVFTIRALGAQSIISIHYGTARELSLPNCIDTVFRGRLKHALLLGDV
jgi:hypothetical protein